MKAKPPPMLRSIPVRDIARDVTPVALSYIPFAILYGALAESAGIPLRHTLAMSALVYSGAAQLIAVQMIAAGASSAGILIVASVLTIRHVMMGASLAPFVGRLSARMKLGLSPLMTDESFALALRRYREHPRAASSHGFFLGANLFLYLTWNGASALGHIGGELLPALNALGLELVFPLLFLAILAGMTTSRSEGFAVAAGAIAAAILRTLLPSEWVIPLTGLVTAAAGVGFERLRRGRRARD